MNIILSLLLSSLSKLSAISMRTSCKRPVACSWLHYVFILQFSSDFYRFTVESRGAEGTKRGAI
jgi:hypothetical protein